GRLDPPALLGIQGPEPDAFDQRNEDRRGTLESDRTDRRGRKPFDTLPPRAGPEPQCPDGAAAATRCLRRRRRAERAHALRWTHRAPRVSRLPDLSASVPPARSAARARAR